MKTELASYLNEQSDKTKAEQRAKTAPTKWTVDTCLDANGYYTIRHDDGTEHGRTDASPIATVYSEANAKLIAAAPTMYNYLTLLAECGDNEAHEIISQITGL